MDTLQIIKNIGLSDQEAECYIALLKCKGARASEVAKEMGINRTTVYPILQSLLKRGFALAYYRNDARYFYAQKPERVAALANKKIVAFRDMIPALVALGETPNASGVQVIETKEAFEQFYLDIFEEYRKKPKKKRTYQVIGDTVSWQQAFPKDRVDSVWRQRARSGIRVRLLLTEDSRDAHPTDISLLREYRYLPSGQPFKSTIDVFGDRVLITSPALNSLAIVIVIPAMVDIFKAMFEMLWEMVGGELQIKNQKSKS